MGRWARDRDVDPVVVDRLLAGIPVQAAPWERCAATRILRGKGHSYARIAARLGTSERQVARDLTRTSMVDQTLRPRRRNEAARRRRLLLPLLATGMSQGALARKFGVSRSTIVKDLAASRDAVHTLSPSTVPVCTVGASGPVEAQRKVAS